MLKKKYVKNALFGKTYDLNFAFLDARKKPRAASVVRQLPENDRQLPFWIAVDKSQDVQLLL